MQSGPKTIHIFDYWAVLFVCLFSIRLNQRKKKQISVNERKKCDPNLQGDITVNWISSTVAPLPILFHFLFRITVVQFHQPKCTGSAFKLYCISLPVSFALFLLFCLHGFSHSSDLPWQRSLVIATRESCCWN